MKTVNSQKGIVALILATAAVVGPFLVFSKTRADTPAATTRPVELGKLKHDRVESLKRAVTLSQQLYSRGLGDYTVMMQADRLLVDAELATAGSAQERIDVLRDLRDEAVKQEELTRSRFKAGLTSDLDVALAESYTLEIEIKRAEVPGN